MRKLVSRAVSVCVALLLGSIVGCGPSTYQVKGKVTFNGKAMAGGGSIAFMPLGEGKSAGGEIAEDGTYTLTTNKPGDGAMLGEFRVVIHQVTQKEAPRVRDGEKGGGGATKSVAPEDQIPVIYADAYKSPLRATVKAENPNEIDFPLTRE